MAISLAASISLLQVESYANEVEVSGKISVEQRYFFEKPLQSSQLTYGQISLALEPEFYWQWNDAYDSLIPSPLS